jgi:serine/threonine-protein kinase
MTEQELTTWLDAYGSAWVRADSEAAAELFTNDARYYETPFDPPAIGREGVREHWSAATCTQGNVRFRHETLAIAERRALVRWWVTSLRNPSGARVELEGILMLDFADGGRCQTCWRAVRNPGILPGMSRFPPRLEEALRGRYELRRELGAGGMATVYLAEDARHDRLVALKVLRPDLAAVVGAERFLAEIRTTAGLQHHHILPLFDSGEADGFLFYVMPYVEGESLRDRLDRDKQLPVDEAVRIASGVAEALAYAHRGGVVHRDIKPANVLLREGHPLVADFGVALAVQQAGGGRLTETGLSVGTPYYMSPEQATGDRAPDARSDLYSVGCMLHEMLVGEPPFTGSTTQAVLAKVLTETPRPVTAYRPAVPPNVEATVLRALERLPADRFGSGDELSRALADPGFRHAPYARTVEDPGRAPATRRALPWALLAASLAVGAWGWLDRPQPTGPGVVAGRARIELPGLGDSRSTSTSLVLSGDGRVLAYNGYQSARQGILVRRLGSLRAQAVPGTEGAEASFLSEDGSLLGFRRFSQLFTVRLDGGVPSPVVGAEGVTSNGRPASLGDSGIVFATSAGGLVLLPPDGSPPDTLTRSEPPEYHVSPEVLPGGRHVLYAVVGPDLSESRIDVIAVESRETRTVLSGGVMTPQYAEGYLSFSVGGGLMAAPFDASMARMTGPVVTLSDQVNTTRFGSAQFAAANGVLVYGDAPHLRLVEVDRSGRPAEILSVPREWHHPRYSPDGSRVVVDFRDPTDGTRDVWLYDLAAGTLARITQLGDAHDPMWLPNGTELSFFSLSHPEGPLLVTAADGSGSVRPLLWEGGAGRHTMTDPGTWLPDGSAYIGGATGEDDQTDLWLIPATGGEPQRLTSSPATEVSPAISGDGRWLAYQSDETGRDEVYVRSLDASGGRLQISNEGGTEPVWAPDGEAVYYLEPADEGVRLVEAQIGREPRPAVLERITVVANLSSQQADNHTNYDIHPSGDRFIIAERAVQESVVAIFNWTELIR